MIRVENLTKNFVRNKKEFDAVNGVNVEIKKGDFVAVMDVDLQDPPYLLKDMYEHKMDPDTRVYLSWGEREAHDDTYRIHRAVADKIEDSRATVKVVCQEGGGHCEADWEKLVPGFMNFLWMGAN